jgi:hypothetical protein
MLTSGVETVIESDVQVVNIRSNFTVGWPGLGSSYRGKTRQIIPSLVRRISYLASSSRINLCLVVGT